MEKPITGKTSFTNFWFVFTSSFFCMILIYLHYYSTSISNISKFAAIKPQTSNPNSKKINKISDFDSCSGKYIYIHDIPSQFNQDLFKNCHSLSVWSDMCSSTKNRGFGPLFSSSKNGHKNGSWYETNQFMLGVIFHNRMMKYKCLTKKSSMASAIYIPFYAGLDVGRNLWDVDTKTRDFLSLNLVKLLREKTEWKKMMGRDHFLVSGRIAWDFRRVSENDSDWGTKLMFLPESKNMTMLSIEATQWNNDFAIPYPTYFHPKTETELFSWQNRVSKIKRKYLFSFAGAPRPNMTDSIRSEIINQCQEESSSGSEKKICNLLNCYSNSKKNCQKPENVMNMFMTSVFCLQPPGDSYTRRSIFDSILSGCIPVFFQERSAYLQYVWHLPMNHSKYSVFIPIDDVKNGKVKIREVLQNIGSDEVDKMRTEVIKLIPRVIYSNGGFAKIEDAFDIAVNGIIERVESTRKCMLEGRDSVLEFGKKENW